MPVTYLHSSDLPHLIARRIVLGTNGEVRFVGGARFATFDADCVLDGDCVYRLDEPIPHSIVDGVEIVEAGRKLTVAGSDRCLVLHSGGVTVLLLYQAMNHSWTVVSRCPLSQSMSILLGHGK